MRAIIRALGLIAFLVCLNAVNLSAENPRPSLHAGDTFCPPEQRLLSAIAAKANASQICNHLPDYTVARLAGLGSFSGPGLNCAITHLDVRPLQTSLCVAKRNYSEIRGVLLFGQFRSQNALNLMSQENWRAALVTELANRTAGLSLAYEQMSSDQLAGAGGVVVYFLRVKQMAPERLAKLKLGQLRSLLIDDLIVQTGQTRRTLRGLSDLELLDILRRG